jgi:nucleotide-binding universal stress UspA family protein
MISNVLVPLDGSAHAERALLPASELAGQLGVKVGLVLVAESDADSGPLRAYLEDVAHRPGLPVASREVVVGDEPVTAILGAAALTADTVVCMATHGHGGIGRLLLGSVSEAVIRRSQRPVLLVGPRCAPAAFDRIMVCFDGSPLAERMLPVAAEWSKTLGAQLWLVQATEPGVVMRGDVVDTAYLQRLARRADAEYGVEAEWDVLHGADPAGAIARHVAEAPGTLVALTTHGRTGLQRMALGSVAMRVAHDATAPLLVLRPVD